MKTVPVRTVTRREFSKALIYTGALGALGAAPRLVRGGSPSRRINLAGVGVAGKGWDDLIGATADGTLHHVVALCDIDHRDGGVQPGNLGPAQLARPLGIGAAARKFPRAKRYTDFRRMLEQRDIDAVIVATPDHMHATIALSAMALGKHVYVEKPLTQTVHESRVMREFAQAKGVVTQMGNQFHSSAGYRCAVKMIQDGVIGRVREAYAWTGASPWPQGIDQMKGDDRVPEGVHWDLWIGVGKPRPYKQHVYHNFNWRAWKEFGSGTLGDMGCHIIDPVVWSLQLGPPSTVSAQVSGEHPEIYPDWSVVTFDFPATRHTAGGFKLTWFDGRSPTIDPAHLPAGVSLPRNGSMFVGEKGFLIAPHGGPPRLYPEADFRDYSLSVLKGMFASYAAEKLDHYRVWTDAIIAGREANSNFAYAGPLNETVMLGTIAQRLPGRRIAWNAKKLSFDDRAATAMVRREYRKGWEIAPLIS